MSKFITLEVNSIMMEDGNIVYEMKLLVKDKFGNGHHAYRYHKEIGMQGKTTLVAEVHRRYPGKERISIPKSKWDEPPINVFTKRMLDDPESPPLDD